MSTKSKPAKRHQHSKAKSLSPEELERRRAERERHREARKLSVRRLLYSREQTAHALGGVSVSTVIRLEREGVLSPIKLHRHAPGAQTFYRVPEVEALASEVEG